MQDQELDDPVMYVSGMSVFLNHWFPDYEQAKRFQDAEGGYLLPYRSQFFVTEADALRELGLDPDDADWREIGFDWARPEDIPAWERLVRKRRASIGSVEA